MNAPPHEADLGAAIAASAGALRDGDQAAARVAARALVTALAGAMERTAALAREAEAAGDLRARVDALRRLYLDAIAFAPFVPRPGALPPFVGSDPSLPAVIAILGNERAALDAAGWASWPYPSADAATVRRGASTALAQSAALELARASDAHDLEPILALADGALDVIGPLAPAAADGEALSVKARVLLRYGASHRAEALALFERAIALEAGADPPAAAVDHGNAAAAALQLASLQRVRGDAAAAATSAAAAERHLDAAIAILARGDPYGRLPGVLVNLGVLLAQAERWDEVEPVLARAAMLATGDENRGVRAAIAIARGVALSERGRWADAVPMFRSAIAEIEAPGATVERSDRIKAYGGLGAALAFSGASAAAREPLRAALGEIDALRASFRGARGNVEALKGFLWIYEAAIACAPDPGSAFAAAERVKWTTFTELLRFLPLRVPVDADPRLLADEQRLLDALMPMVLAPATAAHWTPECDAAQVLLTQIWDRLAPVAPAYVAIRRQQTVGAAEAAELLDDDVSVLVEYVLGVKYGIAYAFVLRRGEPPALVRLDASVAQIEAAVGALRGADDRTPADAYVAMLRRLHEAVWQPLLARIPAGAGVCVVPYGALHNVPFAALHDGAAHAVERNAFVTAQSASALRWWAAKNRGARARCLIVTATAGGVRGGTAFADLGLFEALARERIAPLFAETSIVGPSDATKSQVLARLAEPWDVVHLACHGVAAPNALESYLALAGGDGGDTLSALEIATQARTDATLVTLSACSSGVAETATGDEVTGVAPMFLLAGASSVLATLWPVRQGAAVALTRRFYELWTSADRPSRVRALQTAQRDLLAGRVTTEQGASLAHPYAWSAFTLSGVWS